MSPILKRDVGEHVRHAKRLASAVTGYAPSPDEGYKIWDTHPSRDVAGDTIEEGFATASASSSRRGIGIGVEGDEEDTGPPYARPSWEGRTYAQREIDRGQARLSLEEDAEEDSVYLGQELRTPFIDDTGLRNTHTDMDGHRLYRSRTVSEWATEELFSMSPSRWIDLRNLLLEVRLYSALQSTTRTEISK